MKAELKAKDKLNEKTGSYTLLHWALFLELRSNANNKEESNIFFHFNIEFIIVVENFNLSIIYI
jgi:hypothetical protein